ncbi:MAG: squalene/phytoene synthase family protein, partial [Kitasatospora sp.]|nr:squalene/phytoene synthase family protein [Kitasatospora sp.]
MAAYRYCEAVTALQARNFSYGIRLLPEAKRLAMSALYALARRVDDIGDGDLPAEQKAEALARTRVLLDEVRTGAVTEEDTDPIKVALADAARRFPIP